MIRKLRVKFIAITMALVCLMVTAISGFVFFFTCRTMEAENNAALQSLSMKEPPPGGMPGGVPGIRPGDLENGGPIFILWVRPDGSVEATGSPYFDLSDGALLREIYEAARADGEKTGILRKWKLCYYRADRPGETQYAFLDVSQDLQTLQDLALACFVIGTAVIALFFLISIWLSKWMVRPVEEAWNKQKQFVADASHELKTPLTVILTNAELLQSEEYDETARRRFTQSILSMSRQMRGLVESLLELARVDNGQVRQYFSQVDLSALVEDSVLSFEPVYFETGRELQSQIQPGILMQGSESHLRQVVEILLDNGCKYGRENETVELRLEKQGHHCLLTVTSQGKGLTPQECKDIFKRFYRVDKARAMNHSYGLGLPIAESIVVEHGGRIWATGKDEGNVFSVSLPVL